MATNNINASTAASVEGAPVAPESAESRENSNNSLGEVKFKVNFNPKAICILAGAALAVFIGVRVTNKAVGK